jgi:hypothetical protein
VAPYWVWNRVRISQKSRVAECPRREPNGLIDGNVHLGFVELNASECFLTDTLGCPRSRREETHGAGGSIDSPYTVPRSYGYAFVNASAPFGVSRRDMVLRHETGHVALGAPDIYSTSQNPDYGQDDEMDLMGLHYRQQNAYCARPQMDCSKEEWYSSLLLATGSNPSWTGQFRNSAQSVYLTPPVSTSQTVRCDGTVIGPIKFDEAADSFTGTSGVEVVSMLDGNDNADGWAGNDKLCGGDGAGILKGGQGADTLVGSGGPDTLNGGDGNDIIYDGWGSDTINGGAGTDTLYRCEDSTTDSISNVEVLPAPSASYCKHRNFEL